MLHWRRIIAKLRNLQANKRAEEDLAREVASHLTLRRRLRTARYVA
jgi:hypothetical protein